MHANAKTIVRKVAIVFCYQFFYFYTMDIVQRLASQNYLDICRAVTKGAELADDLYSELILMFHEKPPRQDISDKELVRLFFGYARRTWNLPNSQFNKKYGRRNFDIVPVEQVTTLYETWCENRLHLDKPILPEGFSEIQLKNSTFVQSELKRTPKNDSEMFILEISKLHFEGNTITEIARMTGIDRTAIRKAIIQFEENVRNHYNRCSLRKVSARTTLRSTSGS